MSAEADAALDSVEAALAVLWDFTYQSGPAPTEAETKAEAALQVIEAAISRPTTPPLDVDALRAAIYAVSVRHDWANTTDTEDRTEEIAREYAALAIPTPEPEG